ncbi:hypothetical protein F4777DRAFT_33358 [Nemania sp. FL0916]|nr:hypothetical protein F4777DRAFT_33358 [Nemania sp. FL0916]
MKVTNTLLQLCTAYSVVGTVSAKPGLVTNQEPLNLFHPEQQPITAAPMTWTFTWWTDTECLKNTHSASGKGAKACKEIGGTKGKSLGFQRELDWNNRRMPVLYVYDQLHCQGNIDFFYQDTDCEKGKKTQQLDFAIRSYEIRDQPF